VDEERPIRATLRVVHRRPRADGRIALGTAIAMIGPYERSRIARFLNEMAAELSW
jgi:hypothetical protein